MEVTHVHAGPTENAGAKYVWPEAADVLLPHGIGQAHPGEGKDEVHGLYSMGRIRIEDCNDPESNRIVCDRQKQEKADRGMTLSKNHSRDEPRQCDVGSSGNSPAATDGVSPCQCDIKQVQSNWR